DISVLPGRPVEPLPRATATSASPSPEPPVRRRWRPPCARLTPVSISISRHRGSVDRAVRVLLVSTYELGHQPWHLASPAAALQAAGPRVRTLDLAVEAWDGERMAWPEGIAFSVPMHTAMRLARAAADRVRRDRGDAAVCFYGLYASMAGGNEPWFAGQYE